MRKLMTLLVALIASTSAAEAQVSTRQQMIDTANQVAKVAYCVGLFGSMTSPAAEHLEIGGHISQEHARKFIGHVIGTAAPMVASGTMAVTIPTAIGGDEVLAKQLVETIERAVNEGKGDASRLSRTQVFQQYDACMPLLQWKTEAELKVEERQQEEQRQAMIAAQRQQEEARRQQAIEAQEKERRYYAEQREQQRQEEADYQHIVDTRAKLQNCGRPMRLPLNVPVTFIVDMNQDGTVAKAVPHNKDHSQIPGYDAAVNAMYQALTDKRCQPWPLTKKQYVFQYNSGKLPIIANDGRYNPLLQNN